MSGYIRRVADNELDELLPQLPAIALEGPKAVGKTETARQRASTVHALDDWSQREIVRADPARIAEGERPVLVDEWQRVPESWDVVRRAVDRNAAPGQFLLTGSASPDAPPTHSGAGRIVSVRMRPLTLAERGIGVPTVRIGELLGGGRPAISGECDVTLEDYAREIVASGFPGMRHLTGRALRAQLDGYVQRIVDRDFEEMGHRVRNPATLLAWMRAHAAATSTTASHETIRDAATAGHADKPAKTTTIPYRNVLERLWIIEPVPAWLPTRSHISRLSGPPKHHLADPALAARLVGATVEALLEGRDTGPPVPRDGPFLGHLFESLVTLCVRVYAQPFEATVKHLRTRGGEREIDLVVERADQRVVAVEVKLGRAAEDADVRHLLWLREEIGDDLLDAVVVTTGREAYRRPDGVAVVPAALLGP